jgi:hypothetical protein
MKTITHIILAGAVLLLCINCSGDDVNNVPEPLTGNDPVVGVPDDTPPPPPEPTCADDPAAQIIYTDIEPDFVSDNQNPSYGLVFSHSYGLDLNNDQLVDYVLELNSWELEDYLYIGSNQGDQNGIISVAPWDANPVPLQLGIEISTNPDRAVPNQGLYYEIGGFFVIGNCPVGESNCFYDWKLKGDRFLGLRFEINGEVHYGWARIRIESPTEWRVKDYAYNATPNNPICAGRY